MEKKTSVFSKGQLHSILTALADELRPLKTVKEVREHADNFASQFKPQSRGRRMSINIAELQALVDEVHPTMKGNSASYLGTMVASRWNLRDENATKLMDGQKIKNLVLKGKLKFPDSVQYAVKPRKNISQIANPTELTAEDLQA